MSTETQPALAPGGALGLSALALLGDKSSPRTRRLIGAAVAAGAGWTALRNLHRALVARTSYSVAVLANDPLYHDVHRWVLESLAADEQRSLLVRTVVPEIGSRQTQPVLGVFFDDQHAHRIDIDGHTVNVATEKPDYSEISKEFVGSLPPKRLVLTASSAAGRDAVVAQLQRIHAHRSDSFRFFVVGWTW